MPVIKKIYADGTEEDCREKMSLEEMQEFVGGYIEEVATNINARHFLVVNEDGNMLNLPANPNATRLVKAGTLMVLEGIKGNALLIKR
ncbi:MAG TPA: DUF3846 domain-containing protein [Leptospiraceae bacterium]|nr:DUF3846 domain-containing protein [Leptospiraceae bacterium]